MSIDADAAAHCLRTAGLDESAVVDWIAAVPDGQGFDDDQPRGYPEFWQLSSSLVQRLPPKPKRNEAEAAAAQLVLGAAREQRERFLRLNAEALYDKLTRNRSQFIRLEDLVFAAAAAVPA